MSTLPEHIQARTTHYRKGSGARQFTYSVDFVLIDPESDRGPSLFSRNRFNLLSVWDRDHGGTRNAGEGVSWARAQFEDRGISCDRILLLTQPRFLNMGFNPVSFWLGYQNDALIGTIAEVNNTFGDRHSYMCELGGKPLEPGAPLLAEKMMHVSPFQTVDGQYSFVFNVLSDKILIKINLVMASGGVFANLVGSRTPLSNLGILKMLMKRPFGSLRTIVLIYWQALQLKFRGETYLTRPAPPKKEVS